MGSNSGETNSGARTPGGTPPSSPGLPVVWALILLLVIYPLSIGPAALAHKAWPAARPAIEALYKPVTALIALSPPVQGFFMWYVQTIWRVN